MAKKAKSKEFLRRSAGQLRRYKNAAVEEKEEAVAENKRLAKGIYRAVREPKGKPR